MDYRLDPEVLDVAIAKTGCAGDEELGQVYLRKSGGTVRNYRKGATNPSVEVLMTLRKLTGCPLDEMFLAQRAAPAPGKAVA